MGGPSEILINGIPKSQHVAKWRELLPAEMFNAPSVNVDEYKRKWLDIPYTRDPQGPLLDIYLPEENDGPFPVIVYIHGGGWLIGHKRVAYMEPLFYVLQRGYALVSIDYTLSDKAEFPTQIYEVKTAIRWLREHAAAYNLQADRIATWGDSAGGHLSTLAGTSGAANQLEDKTFGSPEQSSEVQAVVDWFGPADFTRMPDQLRQVGAPAPSPMVCTMEDLFIGTDLAKEPEKGEAANPETYISENAPPMMIQHGDKDTVVPYQQSISFAAKLKKVIGESKVIFNIFEGAVHEDPRFYAKVNLDKVLDFLDQYLK